MGDVLLHTVELTRITDAPTSPRSAFTARVAWVRCTATRDPYSRGVRNWKRAAVVGLLIWAALILVWAGRPWTATIPLKTPKAVPAAAAKFRCGAPLGTNTASSLLSPTSTAYALSGSPCGGRTARRNLAYADVVIAGALVLVIAGARARHKGATAGSPAP
ncbi:MAG: hypothetical protein JO050_05275 [Acidimicrobiia bacterium]|nr:hypothetical protein [Acidimicrobiia bacterium]